MSASPPQPTHSAKRPLEEASSPSRATDQPDAKRPALDKVIKNDDEAEAPETTIETPVEDVGENANGGAQSDQADAAAPTTTAATATAATAVAPAVPASIEPAVSSAATNDETAWIHIRAVISSPEAATIIGKGGENVSNIRKMSGAKCTVSDYQKGAVERILTVSGIVDAVAKACPRYPPTFVSSRVGC